MWNITSVMNAVLFLTDSLAVNPSLGQNSPPGFALSYAECRHSVAWLLFALHRSSDLGQGAPCFCQADRRLCPPAQSRARRGASAHRAAALSPFSDFRRVPPSKSLALRCFAGDHRPPLITCHAPTSPHQEPHPCCRLLLGEAPEAL